jgi:hypothetical protein
VVAALPAPEPEPTVTAAVTVPETETEAETETETETVPIAVATPAPPKDSVRGSVRPARPARTRGTATFARPRTGRATPAKETGSPLSELRINSKPPCQLYIDGRDMGWTPQRGISVPPGRHTVVFKNREFGVDRKVIIDAKVGEVHRVIRDFTEP